MPPSSNSDADSGVHTRIRQQEVVAELGQQALETDDLDQLMHDAAAAVAETLDNEYAKVLELLPGGDEVFLRQGVGWRDGLVGNATVSTDLDSQAGYTLLTEEPIVVDDLCTEGRFSGPELLTNHDVVSGVSVIIGSVEDPWGVLGTYTTEHCEFTEYDANFVQSVANILTSAIENTQTERRFEAIFEDPNILVGLLEPDGTVVDINETAMEYIDATRSDVTGELFWETPWWGKEDEIQSDVKEWTKQAAAGEYVDFETNHTRPDGEQYTLSGHFRPVRNNDGEVVSIIVSDHDITERKEREQGLELFRTLLDETNDSVLVVDPHTGQFIDVNETACSRLGYDRSELLELSVLDMERRFDDIEDWRSHVEDVKAEDAVTIEGVHERKDGTTYPAEVNVAHVQLDREYMVGVARDVTRRKRRERRLRESEQQYRTLAENFPNGIVTLFDTDLRYTLTAGRAFDRLPVSPADMEGERIQDVWPDPISDELEPAFRAALDGETREVELEYSNREWVVHVVPITGVNGNVFGGITIAQDITERKERKRALEESKRRYQTLVEHFPNGAVGLYDEDMSYMVAGGELLDELDISSEEVIGSNIYERYPDDLTEEISQYFHDAFEGKSNTFEVEYLDRDLLAHTLPIQNADDEIYAGMLMVQDITERKEYEQKLKESNERLEQFAYAASHDLQEPLRMVSSYLSLIESRYSEEFEKEAEEFLEFAVDGADRMREMIDALLKYSRVETRGDPFESINLDAILSDAIDDLQFQIEENDAEITADELPTVEGDPSQLRQVFQNLLSNAIEYSGDKPPQIDIEAKRRGQKWLISVHDNGIGIDPDNQDQVFQVFERLHTLEEHSGTGIGLALCQRIVERHGGEIWVDSEPGEGSTFSFTLPAVDKSKENSESSTGHLTRG